MSIIIKENKATRIIKDLPGYEGSEVEVYGRLTTGDIYEAGGDNIKLVSLAIKKWNFTDEKNEPLPVSTEALGNMDFPAFEFLLKELESFAKTEKKNAKSNTNGQ